MLLNQAVRVVNDDNGMCSNVLSTSAYSHAAVQTEASQYIAYHQDGHRQKQDGHGDMDSTGQPDNDNDNVMDRNDHVTYGAGGNMDGLRVTAVAAMSLSLVTSQSGMSMSAPVPGADTHRTTGSQGADINTGMNISTGVNGTTDRSSAIYQQLQLINRLISQNPELQQRLLHHQRTNTTLCNTSALSPNHQHTTPATPAMLSSTLTTHRPSESATTPFSNIHAPAGAAAKHHRANSLSQVPSHAKVHGHDTIASATLCSNQQSIPGALTTTQVQAAQMDRQQSAANHDIIDKQYNSLYKHGAAMPSSLSFWQESARAYASSASSRSTSTSPPDTIGYTPSLSSSPVNAQSDRRRRKHQLSDSRRYYALAASMKELERILERDGTASKRGVNKPVILLQAVDTIKTLRRQRTALLRAIQQLQPVSYERGASALASSLTILQPSLQGFGIGFLRTDIYFIPVDASKKGWELLGWRENDERIIGVPISKLPFRPRSTGRDSSETIEWFVRNKCAPPPTKDELAFCELTLSDPQYPIKVQHFFRRSHTLRRIKRWVREDGVLMEGIVAVTLADNHLLHMLSEHTTRIIVS